MGHALDQGRETIAERPRLCREAILDERAEFETNRRKPEQ